MRMWYGAAAVLLSGVLLVQAEGSVIDSIKQTAVENEITVGYRLHQGIPRGYIAETPEKMVELLSLGYTPEVWEADSEALYVAQTAEELAQLKGEVQRQREVSQIQEAVGEGIHYVLATSAIESIEPIGNEASAEASAVAAAPSASHGDSGSGSTVNIIPAILFQGGFGQTEADKTFGSLGFFVRGLVPFNGQDDHRGGFFVDGGIDYAFAGRKTIQLERVIEDFNRRGSIRDWEIIRETFQTRSGLNELQFFAAGLQTPRLGPLALELALRLGYGWDDPRWKTIQERWFRELISIGPCRDREGRTTGGTCEEWRTRLLDRQTLEIGPGEKNAGFLTSAVAALRVAATPNFDLRVEFSRVFSGHPSTSANRISFGGVYTFNRSEE